MKVTRWGKPSKEYLATLRKKPLKADYERLVQACLEAILSTPVAEDAVVLVAFAYVAKLPKSFPKGILVEKVDDKNIRRIKAVKLLAWLRERGHTTITMHELQQQKIAVSKIYNSVGQIMLDLDVDLDQM